MQNKYKDFFIFLKTSLYVEKWLLDLLSAYKLDWISECLLEINKLFNKHSYYSFDKEKMHIFLGKLLILLDKLYSHTLVEDEFFKTYSGIQLKPKIEKMFEKTSF